MPHAYKTSAEDVTDAVQAVARAGSICQFASGRPLDAATEAAELGLLKGLGGQSFDITGPGHSVASAKDPVGFLMTFVGLRDMADARRGDEPCIPFPFPAAPSTGQ